ncbi:MAG: DUF3667 domain-containing protein [Rhodothermaceae bacterium]|nr:DUF3667 domain-containing protein [Rhodothermaceae bacterium]
MPAADPPSVGESSPVAKPSSIAQEEGQVERCPNCGAPSGGAYCATCGQKDQPLRQPVHRFVSDAVKEYFGIDGRLWRSLGLLLFRPGRLTREYFEGRRARYLRPLRLYLTATLTFFFLLTVLDPAGRVEQALSSQIAEADTTVAVADRLAEIEADLAEYPAALARQEALVDSLEVLQDSIVRAFRADSAAGLIDSLDVEDREEEVEDALDDYDDEVGDLERMRTSSSREREVALLEWQRRQLMGLPPDSTINPRDLALAADMVIAGSEANGFSSNLPSWVPQSRATERMAAARTAEERAAAIAEFARNAISRLPTVMFLLLPVFALLLKLIYVRRGWYYSEHLVFGLHTHAFAFLIFALTVCLFWLGGDTAWVGTVSAALTYLGLPLYFYIAQKRVYGQGWIKTAVKAWLLAWTYGFFLILGIVLAVFLAAAL